MIKKEGNQIEFLLDLFNQLASSVISLDEVIKLIHVESKNHKEPEYFIIRNLMGLEKTSVWKAEQMIKDETYLNMMYGNDWKEDWFEFPAKEIEQIKKYKIICQNIKLIVRDELEKLKWVGIFYGIEEYKAFKYIMDESNEHDKVLFKLLWAMYNNVLIICNISVWNIWVNKEYFPKEKVTKIAGKFDFDMGSSSAIKLRHIQKTYINQNIFNKIQNKVED